MNRRLSNLSWASIAVVFAVVVDMVLYSTPARGAADTVHLTTPHQQTGSGQFLITTISSRNDLISGDSVLIRIGVPSVIPLTQVGVYLNNAKITSAFKETPAGSHMLQGLATGLRRGDNDLLIRDERNPSASNQVILTDYAITGPILSGPHITPYECRTTQNGLGAPLDADCSGATQISYYYRSTSKTFNVLARPTGPYPTDLASTTTTDGRTVPYIVRVETGTINRGVYRIAVLDDPAQSSTGQWKPGPEWNGKLIVTFGCCGSAQYNQGVISADAILSDNELSRGFAFANSTELFNQQHANPHLQGETLMMLKAYFIKNYGVPTWTAGVGGSGGAIQQYLIAQLYPGLLDGIQPGISFPETLMPAVWECRLLNRVYALDPATWTTGKQNAVNGFNTGTCPNWDQSFANIIVADYAPGCGLTDPANKPYNARSNPTGPRCDFFDTNANLLGRDPATGFAYRPTDNVGVQYGVNALNRGLERCRVSRTQRRGRGLRYRRASAIATDGVGCADARARIQRRFPQQLHGRWLGHGSDHHAADQCRRYRRYSRSARRPDRQGAPNKSPWPRRQPDHLEEWLDKRRRHGGNIPRSIEQMAGQYRRRPCTAFAGQSRPQ
jgi:hypothetical protein